MSHRTEGRSRRGVILSAGAGVCLILAGCTGAAAPGGPGDGEEPGETVEEAEEEISPAEDLMREHGLLGRVLLVYEEGVRRIEAGEDLPPDVLVQSAGIVRRFIEDYHEKLEEEFIFPRFEKAGRLAGLVSTLKAQHAAGRDVTGMIQQIGTATALRDKSSSGNLVIAIRSFVRMYRPHAAREDTVLFPALHEIVSPQEYGALGEAFEDRERKLFGQDGFESMVDVVAGIEKALGIDDLAGFTPTA